MNILGYSGLHDSVPFKRRELPDLSPRQYRIAQGQDSAAALVTDDGVQAACAEERFTGEKATGVFPKNSIEHCLAAAKLTPADLDFVAHGFCYEPFRSRFAQAESEFARKQFTEVYSTEVQLRHLQAALPGTDWSRKFVAVPHHLAHAASAFYVSGFEESLILIVDGMGELDSTTVAVGNAEGIRVVQSIRALHSLGILYGVFTLYLGFEMNLDEYKVMGLAPYGNRQRFLDQALGLVHLRNDGAYAVPILFKNVTTEQRETYSRTIQLLAEQFGPPRMPGDPITQTHKDIAAALQGALERTLVHVLRRFQNETGQTNLCMAGGVALNCVANAAIRRSGLFQRMFVQPAAGDDGTALGAALYVQRERNPKLRLKPMLAPLWGPSYDSEAIEAVLEPRDDCKSVRPASFGEIVDRVAASLAQSKVVAWFQGAMEFGPRALGNRSILADPRDASMRERINRLVKKREDFRPFAPAVTVEAVSRFFEVRPGEEPDYAHMLYVAQVRERYRAQLGAVTHLDGSARVQTVSREQNPRFWALLNRFGELTGFPILLNTSFNVRGQPIVRTPREAVETFLAARLDLLAMGDFLVMPKRRSAVVRNLMNPLQSRIAALSPGKRAVLERKLCEGAQRQETGSIRPQSAAGPVPLSFAQQRLWFLDQWEPGNSAYNTPMAIRMKGLLDVAALERSLTEIVRRHEVLRTTFAATASEPVQVIHPPEPFALSRVDLCGAPKERREIEARRLANEEALRPFDLSAGPLMRATLLRLEPDEHFLLMTIHHVATDGWSMAVLYRELSALYGAFSEDNPSPLAELPVQYADFAAWQRQSLQGDTLAEHVSFWSEQLRGLPTLEMPTDHPRPPVQTFHGATHRFQLPQGLTEALRALSRQEGATLFMTLLAAFQSLLHRYSGQEDIVVGTPIANRNRTEIEGLIGFFVNTLVMRTDASGNPSFRELLARVRRVCLDAYLHQDLPFEKLVEALKPERNLNRSPLFQVTFDFQNAPRRYMEFSGLTLSAVEISTGKAKFDLSLSMAEKVDGLVGKFVYNTDLFDAATIERMLRHFQTMLEGIAADPDQRLCDLPILTEKERHQLLVEWNDTAADYPRETCIHELVEAQAERTPDAIAVEFGDRSLSYRELHHRADRLARHLRTRGVGPEVVVGLCVERSIEMIVAMLAILKAGGAYLPLDPAYPRDRLAWIIEDSSLTVLLTQRHLVANLPSDQVEILLIESLSCVEAIAARAHRRSRCNDLAYMIYTSGSTGKPKGVEIEHGGLVNLACWHQRTYGVTPADRATLIANPSFDASVWEVWPYLAAGASLCIPDETTRATPAELLAWLAAKRITLCFLPTPLAEAVLREPLPPNLALRALLTGGDRLQYRPADCLPFCLVNHYGPTEDTVVSTSAPVVSRTISAAPPAIGRPIDNTQVYILDQHLKPSPIGCCGELYVGGAGLARGYRNQPELTAEKFIRNPFSVEPDARLFKTGDLGRYRPDGNIEFLGRIDHQVKIRGFRIELGEIETILAQHPAVRSAVAVAREDAVGDKRLVAYVVLQQRSTATCGDLRHFLQQKLPDYMVPSALVVLDSLPLTPNGKVDRKSLPAPDSERVGTEGSFVAPRTPTEELLAGIWSEILGLKRVGVHDNFLDLGGHSLMATQLVSRLRQAFQIELPVRAIFEKPTIESLALALMERQAQSAAPEDIEKLLTRIESLPDEFAPKAIV